MGWIQSDEFVEIKSDVKVVNVIQHLARFIWKCFQCDFVLNGVKWFRICFA